MLPTVILFGMIAGGFAVSAQRRSRCRRALISTLAIAVAFGVCVGVADQSLGTFAAGTLLALANVAVGAVAGAGLAASLQASASTGLRTRTGGLRCRTR